jgi:Flp pilus assembly protein TadG
MMSKHISLVRSEEGTSIIEMGFAAPILALMLIGMVDMSRGYSAKLQLEQIAQRTVEKIQNTDYVESTDYKTALKAEAAAAADVATTAVTIDSWLECTNNGVKLSFTASCTDTSHAYARYAEVSIQKVYTPMFKTRFGGAEANGTYTLVGTAGVRVQ